MKKSKLAITEKVLLRFIDFLDKHNFFSFLFLLLCGMGIAIAFADKVAIILGALK